MLKKRLSSLLVAGLLMLAPMAGEAATWVSKGQEFAAGAQAASQLAAHTAQNDRISKVAQKLVQRLDGQGKYAYNFAELRMAAPNAFAYPGGYIYVTSGMMNIIQTDDELAFFLAHELGHTEHEHWLKTMDKEIWAKLLAAGIGQAVAKNNPQVQQYIQQAGFVIVHRGYGFDKEWQADKMGFDLLARSPEFTLGAGAVSFSRIDELERNNKNVPDAQTQIQNFIKPHPKTPNRLQKQLDYVNDYAKGVQRITAAGEVFINKQLIYKSTDPKKAFYNAGHSARLIHDKGLANIIFRLNEDGSEVLANDRTFYEGENSTEVLNNLIVAGCKVTE